MDICFEDMPDPSLPIMKAMEGLQLQQEDEHAVKDENGSSSRLMDELSISTPIIGMVFVLMVDSFEGLVVVAGYLVLLLCTVD